MSQNGGSMSQVRFVSMPEPLWERILAQAGRLGVTPGEAMEASLDCFDELGDAWLDQTRWTVAEEGE